MSKGKKKEKNPQIEVRTFNWGPCVIKLNIRDDFKKILLDEIKKSKEDYSSKLAGQMKTLDGNIHRGGSRAAINSTQREIMETIQDLMDIIEREND